MLVWPLISFQLSMLTELALGGTLSSYTWICLTLNFLQTLNPPILPSLQRQDHVKPQMLGGVNVAFDKNLDAYREFGSANKDSIGQLLFQFFRYYAYELDFEQKIVSVRAGTTLPKTDKNWHMLQDNRLCVEEPFNISRNLANTADDTSMRGIHLELRRAFGLIAEGKLDQCCEQYEYPPEELKPSSDFVPPTSRPVIAQAPSSASRGRKHHGRGGRAGQL
jgi:DNA polymerase sigma